MADRTPPKYTIESFCEAFGISKSQLNMDFCDALIHSYILDLNYHDLMFLDSKGYNQTFELNDGCLGDAWFSFSEELETYDGTISSIMNMGEVNYCKANEKEAQELNKIMQFGLSLSHDEILNFYNHYFDFRSLIEKDLDLAESQFDILYKKELMEEEDELVSKFKFLKEKMLTDIQPYLERIRTEINLRSASSASKQ